MKGKEGYYIAVEGPIGVGKTSLATRLVKHWKGVLIAERVDDNPLLEPFYQDPAENAFHLQLYFLIQRSEQQRSILKLRPDGVVVSDYMFAKDDLFAELVLNERQYKLYGEVARELSAPNVRPDVVVYLRAGMDTLVKRIAERGRAFEKTLDRAYLEKVVNAYEQFFGSYDRTPIVRVDADAKDLLHDGKAFTSLANQVAEMAWMSRPEA